MAAQQFWAQLFLGLVFFVIIGFLWFFVVRPILEAWDVLSPSEHYVTTDALWDDTPTGSIAGRYQENRPAPEPVGTTPPAPDLPDFAGVVAQVAALSWRDDDGKEQRFSANRIAALMGGRREEVLDVVRRVRGTDAPAKPQPGPQFEQVGPASYRRIEGT